jgi:hypothetical protein
VNPNARFALISIAALAMASSSLLACLHGDLDLPTAGLRYVAAFVVARIGIGMVDMLLTGYRRGAALNAAAQASVATPVERRRENDTLEVAAD